MEPDRILTTTEAARIAHVSRQTIVTWAHTGRLPALRTSTGLNLFRWEDVVRTVRERREKALARYPVGDEGDE